MTAQYRRWDEPRVKVGAKQMTSSGLIEFTSVRRVNDLAKLTDGAARAAGFASAEALRKALTSERKPSPRGGKGGNQIYRIGVTWVGEDPRLELRAALPTANELAEIRRRLDRLDRRESGPWTREILEWIRDNPHVVSKELASKRGVELLPMKADIRKLKALGLTISHEVGYELSDRGRAYVESLPSA